jgi:undecaprenyl-diphosphatase
MGLTGFWQLEQRFTDELAHYATPIQVQIISQETWQNSGWKTLPTWRVDLEGSNEQPMDFQWAGSLETLQAVLRNKGWHAATATGPSSAMNWLAPEPEINALPILPQVNDGRHQELLLVAPDSGSKDRIMVLRLWPTGMQLEKSRHPVRVGNVTWLNIEHNLPLIAFLRTAPDFDTPLQLLRDTLAESDRIRLLQHTRSSVGNQVQWQGQVLLAWEP